MARLDVIHRDLTEAHSVPGQVTLFEGARLYQLAAQAKQGIVEVGSYMGRSTAFLGLGSRIGGGVPVHAVDHFDGSAEHHRSRSSGDHLDIKANFDANMARMGLNDLVVPVVANSTSRAALAACPDEVDLLFIDGSHDRKSVERDLDLWLPKLVQGGTLAMHDTFGSWTSGPRQAAKDNVLLSGRFRNPILTDSLLDVVQDGPRNSEDEVGILLMATKLKFLGPIAQIKPWIKQRLHELGI
ncbi:MAG: class I SAM-dependent methyltransferase [Patescibacteria group bacterium]